MVPFVVETNIREADESMEKRPERRRMESLQSIPENEPQVVLNSVDTPTP